MAKIGLKVRIRRENVRIGISGEMPGGEISHGEMSDNRNLK